MALRFVAYVDEAGDEGLGKLRPPNPSPAQSKWLTIGGILVSEQNDREVVAWRDEIMSNFPGKRRRDLHFRTLNHDQKVVACELMAQKPLGICCVCSNKMTLLDDAAWFRRFTQKGYLYNYLTRWLLERVTTSLREVANRTGQKVELSVIFSRRGGTDYQSMRDYMHLMRDGLERVRPVRSIDWTVFDPENIKVENHSKWAGLQLADVATSATTAGLEPNIYGRYEPRYANAMAKRYLARNGRVLNCGMALVPTLGKCPLDDAQRAFVLGLNELWQAPGP